MRTWWWGLLGVAACAQTTPIGSFRLPVPTSSTSVVLKTVLAQTADATLILYDGQVNQEYARGKGDFSLYYNAIPYLFSVPATDPLDLVVANNVMQDTAQRPYKTAPLPALDPVASSLKRIVLSSSGEQRTIVSTGGNLFTEEAEPQPAVTETPGPLFVLGSVAGAGLVLPKGFEQMTNWSDAISTFVPPDVTMPLSCAAPFVSVLRSTGPAAVTVPAGQFQAMQVKEIISNCLQNTTPVLAVYEVDRWYAPGVGPVRMTYTDSNSGIHEYRLVSHQLAAGGSGSWPLDQGNSWTYEVHAPDGSIVGAPVVVLVSSVTTVTQP